MALRNRFINPFAAKGAVGAQSETGHSDLETTAESKHPIDQAQETDRSSQDDTIIDDKAQAGTQKAQASTQAWTRNTLIAAYVLAWIVNFLEYFSSGLLGSLSPYIYSGFALHSLTGLTSVIASLISAMVKFPYAKLMDIWGRPQAFAVAVGSLTLGLVMMAACKNVQTYCAAQVFYQIGFSCIDFSMTIFIADTTALKNRAFWIAYASSPYLITPWIYGYAADRIVAPGGIGYRWGFGVFAIIMPIVCAPLWGLWYYIQKKAERMGLTEKRERSGRTLVQSIVHYAIEFDVVGLLIIATGFSLFLLAFNLYSYQANEWRSPLIICFIVIGALLILAFVVWERFWAPVQFMPWALIQDRTVVFTFSMVVSLYLAWYIWDSYFYSLLQVVFNQTVTQATYISNIYTIGSCFWCLIFGAILRYQGRLKYWAICFGVPLTILGVGLMIKFRQPDVNIGYIVMCQIFVAFGGGTLVICEQMTVMAVSAQRNIPAILAIEGVVASIGSALGGTVAVAMWTGIFPVKLRSLLPASTEADWSTIYGSLDVQQSYARGTPTRDAIDSAYGETQRLMLITATCLYLITWSSCFFWKNIDVKKMKQQVHGVHF
ncbi:MFS transporter [Aspergillus indologenus CBS 114.80]|uniref:MFS transporter n=1 Tax=Aspergillus indologenus CBS 114.80 TaxID=1450541 RepID=A0A2V5IXL9_9EURO|nr:MFS transporter [Aspergillus indologenus CBS 114.80]